MAFRRGQWVKLNAPVEVVAAVVDGEEIKRTLPAGTLGIHHPLDDGRKYQHGAGPETVAVAVDEQGNRAENFKGLTGFHQVDPKEGFLTLRCVAVDPAVLDAVTVREDVPAARLATMNPDWTPRA